METELCRIVFNLGDFQYHVNTARGAGCALAVGPPLGMPAGRSPPLWSRTIQTHGDKKGPTNLRGAHQGHFNTIAFLAGAAA